MRKIYRIGTIQQQPLTSQSAKPNFLHNNSTHEHCNGTLRKNWSTPKSNDGRMTSMNTKATRAKNTWPHTSITVSRSCRASPTITVMIVTPALHPMFSTHTLSLRLIRWWWRITRYPNPYNPTAKRTPTTPYFMSIYTSQPQNRSNEARHQFDTKNPKITPECLFLFYIR